MSEDIIQAKVTLECGDKTTWNDCNLDVVTLKLDNECNCIVMYHGADEYYKVEAKKPRSVVIVNALMLNAIKGDEGLVKRYAIWFERHHEMIRFMDHFKSLLDCVAPNAKITAGSGDDDDEEEGEEEEEEEEIPKSARTLEEALSIVLQHAKAGRKIRVLCVMQLLSLHLRAGLAAGAENLIAREFADVCKMYLEYN